MDGDHGVGCRPGEDPLSGDGAGGAARQEQPGPGAQEGVNAKGSGDVKAAQDAKGAGHAKAAQDAKGAGVSEEADDAGETSDCGQLSADEKLQRAVAGVRPEEVAEHGPRREERGFDVLYDSGCFHPGGGR